MNRYKMTIEGVYKNIYSITDTEKNKEWTFIDLDLENDDKSLFKSVSSICDLLNKKENKIRKLERR